MEDFEDQYLTNRMMDIDSQNYESNNIKDTNEIAKEIAKEKTKMIDDFLKLHPNTQLLEVDDGYSQA